MGLTHYWTIKDNAKWRSLYDALVADIQRIVNYVEEHPEWMGYSKSDSGPFLDVSFKDGVVVINDVEEGAETVFLTREQEGFNFCKTNYCPFDVVVQAVLLRMDDRADGAVEVASDADWDEWVNGVDLVKTIFGTDVVRRPVGWH
ncbi:hypothetical protein BD626DRAFT_193685 [Schizophyllum amplum]|uniref:Uncharacterized protein n=1 Tax=Schizophyllum amplum TaxID=97359 RepID=A0A550CM66_9AGAR|nr:hypothetical protein BD626DRAFT_193685 [Auriculariopsis ampla]